MSQKTKILFLDLNAGIFPHSLQALKVLSQFDSESIEVEHLACGSSIPGTCPVKESRGRSSGTKTLAKKLDCFDCQFTARTIGNSLQAQKFVNPGEKNTKFLGPLCHSDVMLEESELKTILEGDLDLDHVFLGSRVVRMALYEWIIKFKKRDLNLTGRTEEEYLEDFLRTTIRFSIHGERFFSGTSCPDIVICHSPQYAANNAFVAQATLRGIPVFSLNGSDNFSEMESSSMIWEFGKQGLTRPDLENWPGKEQIVASEAELTRISGHLSQLLDGRSPFVYSSTGNRNENLPKKYLDVLALDSKVLMTLNSLDEVIAEHTLAQHTHSRYPGKVFASQQDWVIETVEWFRHRPNLGLIVRIHPRELPNRRDSVKSEQAVLWESMERGLPDNVIIDHPDAKVPLAMLLERVDGLTTGWSSTAFQAILYDVPVVSYDKSLLGYPDDIHYTGTSKDQYFKNLAELTSGNLVPDKQGVKNWLVHTMARGSVQLTGRLFSRLRLEGPKWVPRALNGVDRYFYWFWRPLEAWLTVRRTQDGRKVVDMVLGGRSNLYEKGKPSAASDAKRK
jgi:hypothetical protein